MLDTTLQPVAAIRRRAQARASGIEYQLNTNQPLSNANQPNSCCFRPLRNPGDSLRFFQSADCGTQLSFLLHWADTLSSKMLVDHSFRSVLDKESIMSTTLQSSAYSKFTIPLARPRSPIDRPHPFTPCLHGSSCRCFTYKQQQHTFCK